MKLWVTEIPDVPDHSPKKPRWKENSGSESPSSTGEDSESDVEGGSDHRSSTQSPAEPTRLESPLKEKELSEDDNGLHPDHFPSESEVEQPEPESPIRTRENSAESDHGLDYLPSVSWESDDLEPRFGDGLRENSTENQRESDSLARTSSEICETWPESLMWTKQDSESGCDSENASSMSWEIEETASASRSSSGQSFENDDDPEEWKTQLAYLLMFFHNSMGTDIIHCYGMVIMPPPSSFKWAVLSLAELLKKWKRNANNQTRFIMPTQRFSMRMFSPARQRMVRIPRVIMSFDFRLQTKPHS
jgi:hypothetical protein